MIMKKKPHSMFRSGRIHPQFFPFLIWIAAAGLVAALFYKGGQQYEVVGIAQGEISQVCAPVDGKLKAVYVQLFDNVKKGDVVASLDDELLNAQIATFAATAEHLRSQLEPMREQMLADSAARELDKTEEQRRFAVDVERARLNILSLKAQIAADTITLEDYAAEVKIATDLLKKNTIAPYEVEKAQALYNALAKKIQETETQITQAQEQLKIAQQRQDTFALHNPQHPSVDTALQAIRKEAAVQEKFAEELNVQRKSMIIAAPIDGTIIKIMANARDESVHRAGESALRRTGETVLAGDPILIIAQGKPKEIIAYAGERQVAKIKEGVKVELAKKTGQQQIAQSYVTHVGPVVEQMPTRLWMNPTFPQWGLPFVIKVPEGMNLIAGETVNIRIP
jgi:multidrug resistance efflux pump